MIIKVEFSSRAENEELRATVEEILLDLIEHCGHLDDPEQEPEDWYDDSIFTLEQFRDIFNDHVKIKVLTE